MNPIELPDTLHHDIARGDPVASTFLPNTLKFVSNLDTKWRPN